MYPKDALERPDSTGPLAVAFDVGPTVRGARDREEPSLGTLRPDTRRRNDDDPPWPCQRSRPRRRRRSSAAGEALADFGRRLAVLFFGYPPALFGWLFNFLPYFLTGRVAKAVAKESDIIATAKVYTGMVLFPLFYAAQGVLVAETLGPWWAAGVTALAIPCGLWAMKYYALRESFIHLVAASLTLRPGGEAGPRLREMRREVLEVLRPLVEMYK